MSREDVEAAFAVALADAGIATRDELRIPADGKLHRFPLRDGKPGRKTGWAVLYADGVPHGIAGDWRTGSRITWMSDGRRATIAERDRFDEARRRREVDQAAIARRATQKAAALWARLTAAPDDHQYLMSKGVGPGPCRLTRTDALVVPVSDAETGEMISLQFIRPDGEKRFLTGGRMAGGCCTLGPFDGGEPIVIAEGYATGASIMGATSWPVVLAFSAGNLRAVAGAIRERFPDRDLVIAADNDSATVGNPGVRYTTEAARFVRARLATPTISGDFNDLCVAQGPDVVRAVLEEAAPVDTGPAGNPTFNVEAPPGFHMRSDGLYWSDPGDPEKPALKIAGAFDTLAETRDADGYAWGVLLQWRDNDKRPHSWAMPRSLLAGDGSEVRRVLLDGGLYLAPGRAARDKLMAYLAAVRVDLRARAVARTGWHGNAFVLPDSTVGEANGEKILLQTAGVFEHSYRIRGSLDEWQAEVARYAVGNSRLVLAISAGLAAPLLYLCGAESGGFHLRGPSSTGKTTALLVAGSVWGGGDLAGYIRSWRATLNGLEGVAAAHCDTLLCLDELAQVSAREAGEVAYLLANGAGKGRAARDGAARRPARWRVLLFSTGEVGLADKIAEDGRARQPSAGQQVRIIDIPSGAGAGMGLFENLHGFRSPEAFARHLRAAATASYGAAARAFIETVAGDIETVCAEVRDFVAKFVSEQVPDGADGQVARVANRFALVAAAGELATRVGILPWDKGEASTGVAHCFRDWLEARGGVEAAETAGAIVQIRRFLEMHGESRFSSWSETDETRSPTFNRAGFRRVNDDGETEWFVLPEVWRSELCAGYDARLVAGALVKKGLLIPDADGKPQSRHRLPGHGVQRCYRLSPSVLGGDRG